MTEQACIADHTRKIRQLSREYFVSAIKDLAPDQQAAVREAIDECERLAVEADGAIKSSAERRDG